MRLLGKSSKATTGEPLGRSLLLAKLRFLFGPFRIRPCFLLERPSPSLPVLARLCPFGARSPCHIQTPQRDMQRMCSLRLLFLSICLAASGGSRHSASPEGKKMRMELARCGKRLPGLSRPAFPGRLSAERRFGAEGGGCLLESAIAGLISACTVYALWETLLLRAKAHANIAL